ncbi:MAG: polysaccharide deacetylase family protein [Rhodocyclaceae bacterium]|nr:MAG: polysaccharide deacetylase family protein [Rhodocyclaceae bacterium]
MFDRLVRTCLKLVAPGGKSALSILIYHRVLETHDPLLFELPDVIDFDLQMATLKRAFNVLSLADALDSLKNASLPERAACVTFDDGYADNFNNALPVLKRHQISACFFVASGFLDGGCMWNDKLVEMVRAFKGDFIECAELGLEPLNTLTLTNRRSALVKLVGALKYRPLEERDYLVDRLVERANTIVPNDLMMTTAQVRALADSGMEIGGHTLHHPILNTATLSSARQEIVDGRALLTRITGRPTRFFAYPNGIPLTDYSREHVGLVKALGFEAAVSTGWGVACSGDDIFQLPRFTPWGKTPLLFQFRLIHNIIRSRFRLAAPPVPELQS